MQVSKEILEALREIKEQLLILNQKQEEQRKDITILKDNVVILKQEQVKQGKNIIILKQGQEKQEKDMAVLKHVQEEIHYEVKEARDDIGVLKSAAIGLQQQQSLTHAIVESIHARLQETATKEDLEKHEDFLVMKVIKRLDNHGDRIEELEKHTNFSQKN